VNRQPYQALQQGNLNLSKLGFEPVRDRSRWRGV